MTDENPDQGAQAESVLEKLRAALDELLVQADQAQGDARGRLRSGIEALRAQEDEAKRKLQVAKAAGADAWRSASTQTGPALDQLGDAFSKISDEIQHMAGAAGSVATTARDAFLDAWRSGRGSDPTPDDKA